MREGEIENTEQSRSRSRSRSRENQRIRKNYKDMIIQDINKQLKILSSCYEQLSEEELPQFIWGKPEQQALGRLVEEKASQREIRAYFVDRYKDAIRIWEEKRASNKYSRAQEQTYEQYLQKEEQFHNEQERLRAFMRIQQGREQPIDKFVKIIYIYKDKMKMDKTLLPIMKQPKSFLKELTKQQLQAMLPEAEIHSKADRVNKTEFMTYWESLIDLIKYVIHKKEVKSGAATEKIALKPELKEKIRVMLNKSLPELEKLEAAINQTIKNASFGVDMSYWETVLIKLSTKKLQCRLSSYYEKFMQRYVQEPSDDDDERVQRVITSPILGPFGQVAPKLLTTDQQQKIARIKLAQRIFKQDFEKAQQKLQTNLSLPKNHDLLKTDIIEDVNTTYDFIAQEILQFERYKRLQEDQEDFNDWLPCQTEGRFRDRRPIYVNRVRVSCEWNKYNQTHYDNDNPPPKTVQGYKFNIFYPDLLDKSKTPQYFLQPAEDQDFCIIKFKAGPPYLDIAFKIHRKQWDFSDKSGFESIFAKGILHLYFNFKKPRFRI